MAEWPSSDFAGLRNRHGRPHRRGAQGGTRVVRTIAPLLAPQRARTLRRPFTLPPSHLPPPFMPPSLAPSTAATPASPCICQLLDPASRVLQTSHGTRRVRYSNGRRPANDNRWWLNYSGGGESLRDQELSDAEQRAAIEAEPAFKSSFLLGFGDPTGMVNELVVLPDVRATQRNVPPAAGARAHALARSHPPPPSFPSRRTPGCALAPRGGRSMTRTARCCAAQVRTSGYRPTGKGTTSSGSSPSRCTRCARAMCPCTLRSQTHHPPPRNRANGPRVHAHTSTRAGRELGSRRSRNNGRKARCLHRSPRRSPRRGMSHRRRRAAKALSTAAHEHPCELGQRRPARGAVAATRRSAAIHRATGGTSAYTCWRARSCTHSASAPSAVSSPPRCPSRARQRWTARPLPPSSPSARLARHARPARRRRRGPPWQRRAPLSRVSPHRRSRCICRHADTMWRMRPACPRSAPTGATRSGTGAEGSASRFDRRHRRAAQRLRSRRTCDTR